MVGTIQIDIKMTSDGRGGEAKETDIQNRKLCGIIASKVFQGINRVLNLAPDTLGRRMILQGWRRELTDFPMRVPCRVSYLSHLQLPPPAEIS
jgi:hypothetical protein